MITKKEEDREREKKKKKIEHEHEVMADTAGWLSTREAKLKKT